MIPHGQSETRETISPSVDWTALAPAPLYTKKSLKLTYDALSAKAPINPTITNAMPTPIIAPLANVIIGLGLAGVLLEGIAGIPDSTFNDVPHFGQNVMFSSIGEPHVEQFDILASLFLGGLTMNCHRQRLKTELYSANFIWHPQGTPSS